MSKAMIEQNIEANSSAKRWGGEFKCFTIPRCYVTTWIDCQYFDMYNITMWWIIENVLDTRSRQSEYFLRGCKQITQEVGKYSHIKYFSLKTIHCIISEYPRISITCKRHFYRLLYSPRLIYFFMKKCYGRRFISKLTRSVDQRMTTIGFWSIRNVPSSQVISRDTIFKIFL